MFDFTQLTTAELQDAQAAISKLLVERENSDRRKAAENVVNAISDYLTDYDEIKCYVKYDYSGMVSDGIGEEDTAASFLEKILYTDFEILPNGTLEFKLSVE